MILAGTKYRGDFEEKINNFLDKVKNKSDIIIFIDEIHNIINIGNNDNSLDIANILKPSLAKGEINCIGATTINEYYKYIAHDTALSRRFLTIFVDEPSVEETINILLNIKSYYEKYHSVKIPRRIIPYLCQKTEKTILNKFFPDKAIDVLDEACSFAKTSNYSILTYNIVDSVIQIINNQRYNEEIKTGLETFPFLKKYFLRYYSNVKNMQPITSILCRFQKDSTLQNFIKELTTIFNIKQEAIKIINLYNYTSEHNIANIIGAPPGYIGFNNPDT